MDFKKIYTYSFKNKDAVEHSKKCGCFNCGNIFDAIKVVRYNTEMDGNQSAICPVCGTDSVLPDASVKVEPKLLEYMYDEFC